MLHPQVGLVFFDACKIFGSCVARNVSNRYTLMAIVTALQSLQNDLAVSTP